MTTNTSQPVEFYHSLTFSNVFGRCGCEQGLLYFISHVFGRCVCEQSFTVFYLPCIWQVWGAGRFFCTLFLMYLAGVGCRKVLLYFISHVLGRCGVQEGFTVFYLSCTWQVWGTGRFYCILSLMYLAGVGAGRFYCILSLMYLAGVGAGRFSCILSLMYLVGVGAGRFYCILSLMYLAGVGCRKVFLYFISHVFGRCGVQEGFPVFYLSCT